MPPRRRPLPAQSGTRKALAWGRGVGLSAVLLGFMGLITIIPFWWAVGFVYAGFVVSLLDLLILESELSKNWKAVLIVGLLALAFLFSNGIVFSSAPLSISATAMDGNYPTATIRAGISWREPFSELDVTILNPSDDAYEKVSVFIQPDRNIAAFGQLSDLAGVSFMHGYDAEIDLKTIDIANQQVSSVPAVLLATDAGYYVRMDKLPPGRPLRLVFAIASMKEFNKGNVGSAFDKDYINKMRIDKQGMEPVFFWWGHAEHSDHIYSSREVTTRVKIEVTYTAEMKPRTISQEMIFPR